MDFIIPGMSFGYTGYAGVIFPIGDKKKKADVQKTGQKPQVPKVTPPANAKLNSSKAV